MHEATVRQRLPALLRRGSLVAQSNSNHKRLQLECPDDWVKWGHPDGEGLDSWPAVGGTVGNFLSIRTFLKGTLRSRFVFKGRNVSTQLVAKERVE